MENNPPDERLRLVYAEALRGVNQQQQVVDDLRGRAVALLSAAAIATSFLGGLALRGADWWLGLGGLVIAVLFVLIVVLTLQVVMPQRGYHFRQDPHLLVSQWIDADTDEPYSLDHLHRFLAGYLGDDYNTNQDVLDKHMARLRLACMLLGAEIILLVALTVAKGWWS